MPLPELSRNDILAALRELDEGKTHAFGKAKKYALVHEGREYAPKAVVGVAAQNVAGRAIGPTDFSGGDGPGQANHILRRLGFEVRELRDQALEAYATLFRSLKRDQSNDYGLMSLNAAPHQPLLILAVIRHFERGSTANAIPFDEVELAFRRLAVPFEVTRRLLETRLPIKALSKTSPPLWTITYRAGFSSFDSDADLLKSATALQIDTSLAELLTDDDSRHHLKNALLTACFSEEGIAAIDQASARTPLREALAEVLEHYVHARTSTPFAQTPIRATFERLKGELAQLPTVKRRKSLKSQASIGQGSWANVPWIMLNDTRVATSAQKGIYIDFLFREDMSGVYLGLDQGTTEVVDTADDALGTLATNAARIRERLRDVLPAFNTSAPIELRSTTTRAKRYEHSAILYKLYERDALPDDFALQADLSQLLDAYEDYVEQIERRTSRPAPPDTRATDERVATLISDIQTSGFHFEPWQIATFVTALRTKPFAILAGVTGTGKSQLPALVAKFTGARSELIPVRPDWTDSSEVIGFCNLEGKFRPGQLLRIFRDAHAAPDTQFVAIVDEMNLARVEQYFAEVLSRLEERSAGTPGQPLVSHDLLPDDEEWLLGIPDNLSIVGTVNMDESSHGFSRKVLDRAFTLELSDVNLSQWGRARPASSSASTWPPSAWKPRAVRLAELEALTVKERADIDAAITRLIELNRHLTKAQLQIGYRTRDEIALFLLHAAECIEHFKTADGSRVDPLDLAILMKILPRIIGGSSPIRQTVLALLGICAAGKAFNDDSDADAVLENWQRDGRPTAIADVLFARSAARLALMWERYRAEGFTSYWL